MSSEWLTPLLTSQGTQFTVSIRGSPCSHLGRSPANTTSRLQFRCHNKAKLSSRAGCCLAVFSWWLLMWLQKGRTVSLDPSMGLPRGQLMWGPDHRESEERVTPQGATGPEHWRPPPAACAAAASLILTVTTSLWAPMSPPGEGELVITLGLPGGPVKTPCFHCSLVGN